MHKRHLEARLIEQKQIEELRKNWQLLERMFVSLNEAIFILDASTEIRDCNPAASRMFGYSREEMLGKTTHFLHLNETFLQEFRTRLSKALKERESLFLPQFQMRRKNGEIFFTEHSVMPLEDEHRQRIGWLSVVRDISERKLVEEGLQKSEERFALAMEATRDGLWDWDINSGEVYYSPGYLAMLGYSPDDVPMNVNFWEDLIHPDDKETAFQANWNCIQGRCETFEVEFRMQTKRGEWLWILGRGKCIARDGQGQARRLVGTHVDITDRKKAERDLEDSQEKLRALSARLHSVREEERAKIAQDIHDDLGQRLTGLKMDLAWLLRNVAPDQTELKKKVQAMSRSIDQTVKTVRQISTELRPRILDDFGLVAALEWQAREFADKTGIACRFRSTIRQMDGEPNLPIAVFRIFQEALTNVARHSEGTEVAASLKRDGRGLRLVIRDNGRGIDPEEIARTHSLGLVGMRERALIIGGALEIKGKKGRGTTVILRLPSNPVVDHRIC